MEKVIYIKNHINDFKTIINEKSLETIILSIITDNDIPIHQMIINYKHNDTIIKIKQHILKQLNGQEIKMISLSKYIENAIIELNINKSNISYIDYETLKQVNYTFDDLEETYISKEKIHKRRK